MTLQRIRILPCLTIHLLLFFFTSECLLTDMFNGSVQHASDRQENFTGTITFDQSPLSTTLSDVQCLGKFCNETGGNLENGSPILQKVRIRRVPGGDSGDTFFPVDSWTSCRVPDGLRTAEIRCKQWPSSIKCISFCVYGFTYDEGIQRINTCKYKDNRWSKEFDECMPFVDCRLKLVAPGDIRCIRNEILKTPKCEVSCGMYEDKDAIKEQTYSCHASGKWMPELPFCAQPRGDIKLARAPKEIEHKNLKYP